MKSILKRKKSAEFKTSVHMTGGSQVTDLCGSTHRVDEFDVVEAEALSRR